MSIPLDRVQPEDWAAINRGFDVLRGAVSPPVPQARVFNNAAITITTATNTALTFNSERYDSGGLHSTSANTSRLTAPITGLYEIGASIEWSNASVAGDRFASIRLNGTTNIARASVRPNAGAGNPVMQNPSTQYQLAASDYVEVVVLQDSGGNLNINASGNNSPEFWMHRVAGYVNQGV